jgi:hypothetical protein
MLGIHTALHWKWIVTYVGRYLVYPIRGLSQPQANAPKGLVPQRVRINKEN